MYMASPALPAFCPLGSWNTPAAWLGEGGTAGQGEWVGKRELWSPGRALGNPDGPWLSGPGFRLPFLYPHMALAASNFGMSQTWL